MLLASLAFVASADTCTWDAQVAVAEVPGVSPESSGLVASRARPGWWLTHDDKGGAPELYAFRADGTVGRSHLVAGAGFDDWEDIAAGPCPDGDGDCLYIGDIGDNDRVRDTITLYVAREPTAEGAVAEVVAEWSYAWPDGPRDAETVLVHPCTGRIFVVSRTADDAPATVAEAPPGGGTLEPVATLALSRSVTGGDFDHDGDRLALRGTGGGWEWAIDPADPVAGLTVDAAVELPLDRLEDAEALAYGPDGDLWTTGEGLPMPLVHLPCVERTLSDHTCEPPVIGGGGGGGGKDGCGCATAPGAAVGAWLLAIAGLRRRR